MATLIVIIIELGIQCIYEHSANEATSITKSPPLNELSNSVTYNNIITRIHTQTKEDANSHTWKT